MPAPLVPIVAVVVLGALLFRGKDADGERTNGPPPPSSLSVQERIAAALQSMNYTTMMNEAAKLKAEGELAASDALAKAAAEIATRGPGGPAAQAARDFGKTSAGQPVVSTSPNPPAGAIPAVTIPAGTATSVTPTNAEHAARKERAQRLALHLKYARKGQEDTTQVKAFQAQEGLIVDGKYGPKSALAIAAYGIVPPKPLYWHRTTFVTQKQEYRDAIQAYAAKAPQNERELWIEAANVVTPPKAKSGAKAAPKPKAPQNMDQALAQAGANIARELRNG